MLMSDKRKIIIYQSYLCQIGGVETFLYNWCWWLRNFFDITVLYCNADPLRLKKMKALVKCEVYKEGTEYECDIFIRNSVWGTIPRNIKANRMIEMRHANYKFLLDKGKLYQQYHDMGIKEIVGCGEFVSEMSRLVLHDNPTTIKNILLPRKETNKVLRLISCTRIDPEKGWHRMVQLANMMRNAGIKFTWDIFTNNPVKCDYEEIHFWKQRYDIWDYLANADYTVLLSDSEGLSYTVQESLEYQTPCIVTDVGGNAELIKEGINGYLVPLDMNFDINKIKNIPKCPEYDNGALEKWLEYLGYEKELTEEDIQNAMNREEEEINVNCKVRATKKFEGIKDAERDVMPKEGDEWITNQERAEYLQSKGVVEIIEKIEPPKEVKKEVTVLPEIEKPKMVEKKKSTKKKKK